MALPFTNIVGQPFAPSVQREFENRKTLDQGFENTSDLYLPYFSIRRLKSLDSVNKHQDYRSEGERSPEAYLDAPFSTLNNETQNIGMEELIDDDNEYRGRPAIRSINVEMSDFTFYTITVEFVVPDIHDFKDFKNTWLNFGTAVEIEYGQRDPVEIQADQNDINPRHESRDGVIAKFDYNMNGAARSIEGTLTIYSTTWLSVFDEGNSKEDQSEQIRTDLKERVKAFITKENTDNREGEPKDYVYAVVNEKEAAINIVPVKKLIGTSFTRGGTLIPEYDITGTVEQNVELIPDYFKRIKKKPDNLEDYIISKLSLEDKEKYGTKAYYYVSVRAIEEILDEYYEDFRGEGNVQKFYLTDIPINGGLFKNFASKQIDRVLINPYNKTYTKNVDGIFNPAEGSDGEYHLLGDVYIAAPTLWKVIDNSKNIYSFVDELMQVIKYTSANMIDVEQHAAWTDVDVENRYRESGITFIDRNNIRDRGQGYTVFDLYDPREKLSEVDIQTEISEDISTFIFHMSMGDQGNSKKDLSSEFYYGRDLLEYNIIRSSYAKKRDEAIKEFNKEFNNAENEQNLRSSDLGRKSRNIRNISSEERQALSNVFLKQISNQEAGKSLLDRINISFDQNYANTSSRVAKFIEIGSGTAKNTIIGSITYIFMLFETLTEIKKMDQSLDFSGNSLVQIPLTTSFAVDGIAGIVPSQAFKINPDAFPIAYADVDEPMLFVVNGLSHTLQGNDWSTTISGTFYLNQSIITEHERLDEINKESYIYRNYLFAVRYALLKKLEETTKGDLSSARELDDEGFFNSDLTEEQLVKIIEDMLTK